jgi:GNAT superfamily N-acetyltransferase
MRFPNSLQDRFGHCYRIEFARSRELWAIRVWDGLLPAAYLYAGNVRGKGLRIQDLKVADSLVVCERALPRIIRKLLGLPRRVASYRRRGIATALIAAVITYCANYQCLMQS